MLAAFVPYLVGKTIEIHGVIEVKIGEPIILSFKNHEQAKVARDAILAVIPAALLIGNDVAFQDPRRHGYTLHVGVPLEAVNKKKAKGGNHPPPPQAREPVGWTQFEPTPRRQRAATVLPDEVQMVMTPPGGVRVMTTEEMAALQNATFFNAAMVRPTL